MKLRSLLILFVPALVYAGATASSFKPEHRKGANFYNAQSAMDGNPESAWMVPGESPNRGEWIMVDLPKSTVDKIGATIGWALDEESFTDYARLKTVKAEGFSLNDSQELIPKGSSTATFSDISDWQVVDIDDIDIGEGLFGGKLKIHVVDIFDGNDFPNLAVSEIMVYLKEFDIGINIKDTSEADGSNIQDLMLDGNPKTFWASAKDGAHIDVASESFGISSIGIQPGPNTTARPKTVKITANNRSLTHTMEDKPDMQWLLVPSITGYTGGAFGRINVEFLDFYGDQAIVGVAEIQGKATNSDGL